VYSCSTLLQLKHWPTIQASVSTDRLGRGYFFLLLSLPSIIFDMLRIMYISVSYTGTCFSFIGVLQDATKSECSLFKCSILLLCFKFQLRCTLIFARISSLLRENRFQKLFLWATLQRWHFWSSAFHLFFCQFRNCHTSTLCLLRLHLRSFLPVYFSTRQLFCDTDIVTPVPSMKEVPVTTRDDEVRTYAFPSHDFQNRMFWLFSRSIYKWI